METWFIVLLSIIGVIAVTLLLFLELAGDDLRFRRPKHRRGSYINDETALIYSTIKSTPNPKQAWMLFSEYMTSNNKMYLKFVGRTIQEIAGGYADSDIERLKKAITDIDEMKTELKDQHKAMKDCLKSIDEQKAYEYSAWFELGMNNRFAMNGNLKRLACATAEFREKYDSDIPKFEVNQLYKMADDIEATCNKAYSQFGTGDVKAMRQLRKELVTPKAESWTAISRLYGLLNDPNWEIEHEEKMALLYAFNCMQECHCLIYTLRRFIFSNICLCL